jgi:hypothetical protein
MNISAAVTIRLPAAVPLQHRIIVVAMVVATAIVVIVVAMATAVAVIAVVTAIVIVATAAIAETVLLPHRQRRGRQPLPQQTQRKKNHLSI